MTTARIHVRRLAVAAICALTLVLAGCSDGDDNNVDLGSGAGPGDNMDDGGQQPAAYRLQLLHFADMDGSTDALTNVLNFSRLINAFKSVPGLTDNTLVLSSGDNYIPGPRFFAAGVDTDATSAALGVPGNGRGDIVFLNAFATTASALGNHDLDQGTPAFADLIAADDEYAGAAFPYLSTNLDFSTDSDLAPLVIDDGQSASQGAGKLTGSATVEIGGQTIGLVGASTPILASITSTGAIAVAPDGFTMDDAGYDALAAEIQPAVDALTARGIDKIILMTHMQQIAIEKALATRLNDVDIIIAGGSNTLLADSNDVLRAGDTAVDTYPLSFDGPDGSPTLVVNVDGDYKYLGRLVMSFDDAGVLLTDTLDLAEDGAWASTDAIVELLDNRGLSTDLDDTVADVQAALQGVLADQDGNIQGNTTVYLDGRRTQVRTEETNLGNLTADANLFYANAYVDAVNANGATLPPVQVSLKNGGGIRDDIGQVVVPPGGTGNPGFNPPQANTAINKPAGGISQFDIGGALRFNNSLTLITVTAAELRDIMEYAVAASTAGATPGQFPQIGGMRIAFDTDEIARSEGQMNRAAGTDGSRIRTLEILGGQGQGDDDVSDRVVVDGVLQGDASRPIRMVLLAFTAQCVSGPSYDGAASDCGDGYPLKNLAAADRADLDPNTVDDSDAVDTSYDPGQARFAGTGTEQDAFAEYLQAVYPDTDNAFDKAETPAEEDARIVNLKARREAM